MLAAVARVRVATTLPDITFLWQYYAGRPCDGAWERSARFRGSKGRPVRTEDALCSAEVTWTNWWPWTRGRPFRFFSRRDIAGREIRQDPWRHQQQGLAVFLAPGFNHIHKLPIPVPEESFLGDHFHFKPLLPLLEDAGSFWLLTISANHTRLYHGFRIRKEELLEFLHRIVPPVEPLIKRIPAPVIVAAPPEVQGHFREIAGWREIQPDGITENPDALSEAELHRGAYALVEPKLAEARAAAVDRLNALLRRARRQPSPRRSSKPRATTLLS